MGKRSELGRRAEAAAEEYLLAQGLQLVERNFRRQGGEIDLIMRDANVLVFVEVRCRRTANFADPALTVDRHKQRKLVRTAALFAARHRRFRNAVMRFDVVAMIGESAADCRWLRDAFRPEDSAL